MPRLAADKRLCSLELHAPSQLRTDAGFSLFAVLSFDVKTERNTVETTDFSVRYGFHAAELRLVLKNCEIAPAGRYVKLLRPRVIRTETERKSVRDSHANAKIGLGIAEVFGFITPSGRVGHSRYSAVKATILESNDVEIVCAVVQRHGDYWRIYGIENSNGVLCGQLLGDEKLCDIILIGSDCVIRGEVVIDLTDLWVSIDGADDVSVIGKANRDAICTALVAKSLRGKRVSQNGLNTVLLAEDRICVNSCESRMVTDSK